MKYNCNLAKLHGKFCNSAKSWIGIDCTKFEWDLWQFHLAPSIFQNELNPLLWILLAHLSRINEILISWTLCWGLWICLKQIFHVRMKSWTLNVSLICRRKAHIFVSNNMLLTTSLVSVYALKFLPVHSADYIINSTLIRGYSHIISIFLVLGSVSH